MKLRFVLVFVSLSGASVGAGAPPSREGLEHFEAKIRPVLVKHCYECHSARSSKVRGELLLDTAEGIARGGASGPLLVAGKPGESLLLQSIRHENLEMPPKEKLPAAVVSDFERWITLGAPVPVDPPKAVDKAGLEFFEKKIRPVLTTHCFECHSEKAKILKANLRLDSREGLLEGGDSGPAIVPGKSGESLLIKALQQAGPEMPPKGKLSDAVIEDFIQWIDRGAPDPRDGKAKAAKGIDLEAGRRFWAFQPPKPAPLPQVKNTAWPRTEIDRHLLAAMESKGLAPAPDAERATLFRRLSFDLTGLPPAPEEIRSFENDRSPDAVEKVVDRLLSSPRFGERWGRHWLDVARYAESSGKERNVPYRMAWRYRDYVIDAFNADMPYDQFIREQLAGDLLPAPTTEDRDRQLIATGFLTVGPQSLAVGPPPEQFLLDLADEQLDTTFRAFQASTAACARCHDHKFDPIPTTDYYALIGIFRSTESVSGMMVASREFSYTRATPLGDKAQREGPTRELQQRIGDLEKEAGRLRNVMRDVTKKKDAAGIEACKQSQADVAKRLEGARAEAEKPDCSTRFAMAVRDREAPADYAVRIRGELDDLGPVVPRGFLSVIAAPQAPKVNRQQSGRLELAQCIAAKDNPLTARVIVNRLWAHLFGKGLVDSVDNFGTMGDRPTHPELLDHLALRFMDEGWSLKRAIREMVLSRAYQLSDRRDESAYTLDPGNKLYWRFGPRRLEAEPIRDAMLAVSGQLNATRPAGSTTLTIPNLELGSTARTLSMDDSPRCRAVYLPMLRGNVPEMLTLFDMADPSLSTGQREVTTVATQALYLMNSKFVQEQSRRFADRILNEANLDVAGRIDRAYQLALGREPTDAERQQVQAFLKIPSTSRVRNQPWIDFCQSLFCSGEFLYVR